MKVGELIRALEAFDPELTVVIPRSEGGLEDVVACYEDIICRGRIVATYEAVEPWSDLSNMEVETAEKMVVIDMDPQISGT